MRTRKEEEKDGKERMTDLAEKKVDDADDDD